MEVDDELPLTILHSSQEFAKFNPEKPQNHIYVVSQDQKKMLMSHCYKHSMRWNQNHSTLCTIIQSLQVSIWRFMFKTALLLLKSALRLKYSIPFNVTDGCIRIRKNWLHIFYRTEVFALRRTHYTNFSCVKGNRTPKTGLPITMDDDDDDADDDDDNDNDDEEKTCYASMKLIVLPSGEVLLWRKLHSKALNMARSPMHNTHDIDKRKRRDQDHRCKWRRIHRIFTIFSFTWRWPVITFSRCCIYQKNTMLIMANVIVSNFWLTPSTSKTSLILYPNTHILIDSNDQTSEEFMYTI